MAHGIRYEQNPKENHLGRPVSRVPRTGLSSFLRFYNEFYHLVPDDKKNLHDQETVTRAPQTNGAILAVMLPAEGIMSSVRRDL